MPFDVRTFMKQPQVKGLFRSEVANVDPSKTFHYRQMCYWIIIHSIKFLPCEFGGQRYQKQSYNMVWILKKCLSKNVVVLCKAIFEQIQSIVGCKEPETLICKCSVYCVPEVYLLVNCVLMRTK